MRLLSQLTQPRGRRVLALVIEIPLGLFLLGFAFSHLSLPVCENRLARDLAQSFTPEIPLFVDQNDRTTFAIFSRLGLKFQTLKQMPDGRWLIAETGRILSAYEDFGGVVCTIQPAERRYPFFVTVEYDLCGGPLILTGYRAYFFCLLPYLPVRLADQVLRIA